MRVVRIGEDPSAVDEASSVLSGGGIIAYPTETFYALGARFDSEIALEKLTELKEREEQKPFPLIIPYKEDTLKLASSLTPLADSLIERYWPGPLTLVLEAVNGLSALLTSEGRVAVRVPGESPALVLARACGFPITSTSANPSGRSPAVTAGEVIGYFDQGIDLVLDGGPAPGGSASTIVDATGSSPVVLRQGGIRVET